MENTTKIIKNSLTAIGNLIDDSTQILSLITNNEPKAKVLAGFMNIKYSLEVIEKSTSELDKILPFASDDEMDYIDKIKVINSKLISLKPLLMSFVSQQSIDEK